MSHLSLDFRAPSLLEVERRVEAAGLLSVQTLGEDCPDSQLQLRDEAAEHGPILFSAFGAELPRLVPAGLARVQVLYFALPASMKALVPRLLQSNLDCHGHLTDHPWEHAVYLALRDQTRDGARAGPLLSFRADALDLSRAFAEGFALLMVECNAVVHCRTLIVDDDLAVSLSACQTSTFQRPLRIHSVRYLQERTRAVEDTGIDPEGPPNGGHPVVLVRCSPLARREPFDLTRLPEHKRRHLPRVRWHRTSDAVIGWLPKVTHFHEECAGGSALVLKVTAMPEMYKRIQLGRFTSVVQLVQGDEEGAGSAYVLLVESDDDVCAVTLPAKDARFEAVLRYWARVGQCDVAFENFHNGRLHRCRLAWPQAVARAAAANETRESGKKAHDPSSGLGAGEALVEARAREKGVLVTCYSCGVSDQEDWRAERDEGC